MAGALGVKMIYVIRLIKRLSARSTSELQQAEQTFAIDGEGKRGGSAAPVPRLVISRTTFSSDLPGLRGRGQIRNVNYDECFSAYRACSKHSIVVRNYRTGDERRLVSVRLTDAEVVGSKYGLLGPPTAVERIAGTLML